MGQVIELFVDQFLAIDQGTPASNPFGQAVQQVIAFTDVAKNYRTVIDLVQVIQFGQVTGFRRSVYNLSVSDHVSFYQQGSKNCDPQVITQFFYMGQTASPTKYEAIQQSLLMTQLATFTLSRLATSTLSMVDLASFVVHRSRTVSQTLIIGSSGSGYLLRLETYSIILPTISGPNTPEC